MAIQPEASVRRGDHGHPDRSRIGDDGLTDAERSARARHYQATSAAHPTKAHMEQMRERARALADGQQPPA